MTDQTPLSIADIQAARNSKLAAESDSQQETNRIVSELEEAHEEALQLKEHLRQREGEGAVPQQAFPHGGLLSGGAMDSADEKGVGEKVAEGIAQSDQTLSTAARDAVHRLSEGVSAAGNTVANAAGAAVDRGKEALQGTMGTRAANAEGRHTTGYEGAVFSSDDPDYKSQQPGVSESRTAAHTLDELKDHPSGNPTIATPKEAHHPGWALSSWLSGGGSGKPPVIASPREGIAVGDQSGGANIAATAESYTKSITSAVKDAFTRPTPGSGAPAVPSDQDPRTANVPVGDFKALHEALGLVHSGSNDGGSSGSNGGGSTAAASDSRDTTDQDNAGSMPSIQGVKEGWEGLKAEAQQGAESASEKAQQGLATASDRVQQGLDEAAGRVQEAVGSQGASEGSNAAGGGLLGGLAGIVSGIATKVNLANSSEELVAGGTVPDAAAAPAAADGPTATPAPEATAAAAADDDAAGSLGSNGSSGSSGSSGGGSSGSSDAVTAAKGTASDAAERVKQGPVEIKDTAAEQAGAAADAVNTAKETVVDSTSDGAGQAAAAASAARDTAAGAAGDAKASAGGALSGLVQGAKEGFVGAYDAAASLLVGGDDPHSSSSPPPPAAAGGGGGNDANASPPPAAEPPNNVSTGGTGLKSGAVGSGHAAAPKAGIGAVLQQGWEDLKHGGAKAPHAVSTGGETSAAHDVTSNVERSKHLDDEQQAKIYKAETYSVSPGAQAASDQASTDGAHKGGVVAGDKRQVTGTVPHDKPDSYRVQAGHGTRFDGNKGIGTGFGTGSAAPWSGDESIKHVSSLFSSSNTHSSLDMGGLSAEEQARLVDAAAAAATAQAVTPDRAGSSSDGSVRSWVNSMSAVWRHLGVASAKGPTGKDVKDIQFETPDQDAVVDPERGVTLKEGHSPGHKVQVPPPHDVTDPQLYKDKAERLGKVLTDTFTTTSEEAASDPNNLKGKSSDNRPDGLAHYTKLESEVAADTLSRTPEATASALGTAGEMVSGAAGHIVDKVKELGTNITQHGDFLHPDDRMAKTQAAVDRGHKMLEQMGDVATDHRAVQELQQQHLAVIGDPAHKRETLGDKVIGPLVKDASDDTRARELAASYNEWKQETAEGKSPTQNLSPATAGTPEGTGAATGASSGSAHTGASSGGSSGSGSGSSGGGSGGSSGVGDAVKGLGQEVADTARSTHEVVKIEGKAAGGAVESAADKAGSSVGGAVDVVKGLASEAADTARATGEVVSMEASSAQDSIKGSSDRAAAATSDAAHDAQHTARHAAASARSTAQQAADRASAAASDVADRAREGAREAKEGVKGAAGRVGESVRDAAGRAGEAVQGGVDAVAEGSGRVAGAGAERMSEAQEAAAQAGQKAGATAGGVLSSVGETAKGLLGALLGPFEREGAFDESTAALTGPPKDFDPIGAEQATGADMSSSQAPAVKHTPEPAIKRATGQGPSSTTAAAAPAGADVVEEAKATAQETKEGIKARLQAGIDDTARAAGLTAGHIESALEGAKQQFASVQDKIGATTRNVAEDIHVPPAELTTNTEELLRQRAATGQQ